MRISAWALLPGVLAALMAVGMVIYGIVSILQGG